MKTKTRENERRDSIIIIILILLLGFICIIITSGWALRFTPSWKLDTNMGSNLNPNSDFLTNRPVSLFEPLDSAILTQPAWFDTFLTPGASFKTRIPLPTATVTSVPPKTSTPVTPTVIPSATNTLVIVSPTNTKATFPPPPPSTITNTPVPVPPSANLSITKTNGVATITAGSTTTYTVRVTNLGPSNVTGAILSDPLAIGLSKTAVVCSATPGLCAAAPTVAQLESGAFALPALANGQFYEITLTVNVTAVSGSVTNIVTVTPPVGITDPTPGNNTASDMDTVTPVANLSITKTDGVASITAGSSTTYTVRVTNLGPSNVTGSILSDPVAIGLSKTAVACSATPGQCLAAPTVAQVESGALALPALASGQFYEITITANVTALSGNVTNAATVTTPVGTVDPTPANNTTSDTNTVTPVANLSITKTDGVGSVTTGASTIYTVRVTNAGPSSVTGAVLSDVPAIGLSKTAVACSATPGQCVTAPMVAQLEAGTFALPAIASGQFYEITITANVTALSGTVTNIATISAPVGTVDPIPGNDSTSDTDTVTALTDLVITKDDGSPAYTAGSAINYTIVVSNAGPSNAIGASVADTIPAAITGTTINCVASGTAACGTNASAGNDLSYTGVNIPAGAGNFLTITVSGTVNAATTGNLVNTATVTAGAGQTDPTPGNNTATDTDTQFIPPSADLQITKTDNATEYAPGISVQYTIVVSNAGPSNVTGAVVTDNIPAQITSWAWACTSQTGGASGCTAAPSFAGNFTDTVDLPSGAGITYTVTAIIDAAATGSLVNTATVSSAVTDPAPANNTATDTDTLIVPDVQPIVIGSVPDGAFYSVPTPGCLTLNFPITVGGNPGFDFVYYEQPNGSGILLDWVIVQVSAGQNWLTIFNWGDEVRDTNTNMDFNSLSDPVFSPLPPPEEPDERDILTVNLYNNTGVAIDLDGVVPAGTYPFVRFCAPPGDLDGKMEIDAIAIIP